VNARLDRPDDSAAVQPVDELGDHGLSCRVSRATHDRGRLLDIVASRGDLPTPTVDVVDVGVSDHLCNSAYYARHFVNVMSVCDAASVTDILT